MSYERNSSPNPTSRNGRRNEYSYNSNNNNNNNPSSKKNNDDDDDDIGNTPNIDVKKSVTNPKDKTDTATPSEVKSKKPSTSDNKSTNLESLTLKDLKVVAKEKGLPVSGKKEEVLARIIAAGGKG